MLALVALAQLSAVRSGAPSPIAVAVTSAAALFEEGTSALTAALRSGGTTLLSLPGLQHENAALRARNERLAAENARLYRLLGAYRAQLAIAPRLHEYADGVEARVIGFPPENESRSVTIDKGTHDGVGRDDGVLAAGGVVGTVTAAGPFTSQVALITDYGSSIPAVVRSGHYWGIAKGNGTSVRVEYISQDAPLRLGESIVTGEARSFHSGALIGTIVGIERGDADLYQTAIVKPAVDLSSLDRVVVVPK